MFSLIGYDNRVMLKEETNNNSVKLFVLSEGSTTANPKYTTDYPDVVAQSIIQNKGITMVLERNGSLWNTYVKVGDTYYLVHSGVACGNIGTNDITNILVQCSEATTSNRACVKEVTISENPSAITKLAYKSNGIATTASNADVSAVLVSGDFRAEFFIGKDALNYDYQTGTASEQFGVQCRFYNTTTNANANFQLLRWGNKIYIKNTNNNKGFVIMELSSDSTTSSPKYTATEGWEAVCEELIKNNGLTFMVERINGKWNVYAKVNDVYYKALENLDINDMGTNDIDMVKLQSGNATSTNRAIVKDLVIETNLSND